MSAASRSPAREEALSVAAIAAACGLRARGDTGLRVRRLAAPERAGPEDLAVALAPRYAEALRLGEARVALLWPGADWRGLGLAAALFAPTPRLALADLGPLFDRRAPPAPGVHPTAVVAPSAELGEGVHVGPLTVIEGEARLGDGAVVLGQSFIGRGAAIGAASVIHPGARIGAGVRMGARVRVLENAVVGSEGFSFAAADGRNIEVGPLDEHAVPYRRIPALAAVEVGDDVEIGASTAIDRGTIADTVIGPGTKIDNLVQVGHNARIGAHCLICGQVGIAGSAVIGDRVVLGGRAAVADHVSIGAGSLVAAGTLVARDVPAASMMIGVPALPRDEFLRQLRAWRRLPRLVEQLRARLDFFTRR